MAEKNFLDVTHGLDALRRDNPWPELETRMEPFYLSLDGGGRQLVIDVLQQQNVGLMVEVGCFLCGSTLQWLKAKSDLTVIGVDPWGGNFGFYIRKRAKAGNRSLDTLEDPIAVAEAVERYGNFCVAVNNVTAYRDRFIPVRQFSPAALQYLQQRSIEPQLIYIDANKSYEDLQVAHELFPDAILCGDDWNVTSHPIREHVERFARENGFVIEADLSRRGF